MSSFHSNMKMIEALSLWQIHNDFLPHGFRSPPPRRESQCFLGSNVIPLDPLKGSHRVREGHTHTFSITWTVCFYPLLEIILVSLADKSSMLLKMKEVKCLMPTQCAGVLSWNKLTALGMFALCVGGCEPEFDIQGPTLFLDEICELLKAVNPVQGARHQQLKSQSGSAEFK